MKSTDRTDDARRARLRTVLALTVLALALGGGAAMAAGAQVASRDVFWIWNPAAMTGSATLVRNDHGVTASLQTSGLPAGHAMTMWIIAFNNPAACAQSPCMAADLFNPAVQGDFLYGAGNLVGGNGRIAFGGHRRVGDNSGSGHLEVGTGELAVGLIDPWGAEIHLVVHSHGPAVPGATLREQIGSFLGGCAAFLGDALGIAQGPDDVPLLTGDCASIQAAVFPAVE